MRTLTKALLAITTAAVAAVGLAGCSTQSSIHMDGSRHTLYGDVRSLAADSSAVVEVEIGKQFAVEEDMPITISTAVVLANHAPEGLGLSLKNTSQISVGEEITVRQMGNVDVESSPVPILTEGGHYLLFLTPSMLEGAAASQFWVTGGSAGIYELSSGSPRGIDAEYTHVESDEGDTLPASLTVEELSK